MHGLVPGPCTRQEVIGDKEADRKQVTVEAALLAFAACGGIDGQEIQLADR